MDTVEYSRKSKSLEEKKWDCRKMAYQVEIQTATYSSMSALVKTFENSIDCDKNVDRLPAIDGRPANVTRSYQDSSIINIHKSKTKDSIRESSSRDRVAQWTSDYYTNLRNERENDEDNTNSILFETQNKDSNNNNNETRNVEFKEKNVEDFKGLKGWLKKRFRNSSEEYSPSFLNSNLVKSNDRKFISRFQSDSKPLESKLSVFDKNRRPLTDFYGNVLKNSFGQLLLLFDNKGRPVDKDGAPVFDSRGNASNSRGFSPQENHRLTQLSPINVYDSKGYPLTGLDGHILLDPSGEKIIKLSRSGCILSDINGGGVWDIKGIPLCPIGDKWLDQEGKPYRFFLKNGLPATDTLGRELFTINNESLIIRDSYGRPDQVQDIFGVSIMAYAFDGTLPPPNEIESFCLFRDKPLRLYNSTGHPFTDVEGRVLYDSLGNPLVLVDFHHNPLKSENNTCLFDERRMPLFCNPAKPMKAMDGKPFLLFDKYNRPLTDTSGVPLVYASGALLLKFDEIGRPYADQTGKPICDINGNELNDPKFDPSVDCLVSPSQLQITFSGKAGLVVYDRSGRPLTDNEGNALVNSDGTSLEFNIIKQKRKVLRQEYDNFGRPLYDKCNRNLYCHGKLIFNIFGETIIDIDLDKTKCDYARSGNFNIYGIPVKDKYHRDLYDETGMPLCDKRGIPESKEVRNCGTLLSVSDAEKKVRLPRDYARTLYALCFDINGLLVGFPSDISVIPDEWILPSNPSDINMSLEEDQDCDDYPIFVRTSTFSEYKTVHEILALYPPKNKKI